MFISVLVVHRIEQVSFSIYGSIEIAPTTTDLDIRLVQIPGMTSNSTPFGTKIFTDSGHATLKINEDHAQMVTGIFHWFVKDDSVRVETVIPSDGHHAGLLGTCHLELDSGSVTNPVTRRNSKVISLATGTRVTA